MIRYVMIQKYKAEFDSDASLLLVHNRYVGRTVIHPNESKAQNGIPIGYPRFIS